MFSVVSLGMEAAKETPCTPPKDGPVGPDGKKLKPCCACPETKRPRDECIMEKVSIMSDDLNGPNRSERLLSLVQRALKIINVCQKGEENCGELIEAHKACMRALGFKI